MTNYTVSLYQVVKGTKKIIEKVHGESTETEATNEIYRAFNIKVFLWDESGRRLIGKYHDKFGELWFPAIHLFCKKIDTVGTFTSEDIDLDKVFPTVEGDINVWTALNDLKKYGRVIIIDNFLALYFKRNCKSDNLRKAFSSRKFPRDADLPNNRFIIVNEKLD